MPSNAKFSDARFRDLLSLEELIGRCAFGALARHVGFQPVDLVVQKLHARRKLLDPEVKAWLGGLRVPKK